MSLLLLFLTGGYVSGPKLIRFTSERVWLPRAAVETVRGGTTATESVRGGLATGEQVES